ncbi:VanZ family protein [Lactobacillus halodurans]|uniref:VanZ family protein n=2 Tax=Companilactobacillus halodurans TaxID=2584183 RepID=A0A5P0ZQB3_9LACO|nr:VanZ family protein [Companilactobacillus halodurans]MQS97536.1 VanZ family protein [Companilactobacillus halodurans]
MSKMIFLGPLYDYIYKMYAMRINHFPLIRLSFYAVDKAILYTLFFIVLRFIWIKMKKKDTTFWYEFWLDLFVFYVFLLFALTVFREGYFIWQFKFYWHRPLSEINIVPLIETFKLADAKSLVDFIYNLYGNIMWFVPMGFFIPALSKKHLKFFDVVVIGALISISIETMQFVLNTGVTDIDDVIFNTIGAMVGYLLFFIGKWIKKSIKI